MFSSVGEVAVGVMIRMWCGKGGGKGNWKLVYEKEKGFIRES